MKSYLSLIPISAKVRRRQNRMTLLCIIISVFLATAVFSMAEMGLRMEQTRLTEKHGGFHFQDVIGSDMGQSLLLAAGVLFMLIVAAGVFMISSSINSSVAQRTEFFGMMRCIGMSKQQIKRFVRLEALNWCKTAVPIGVVLGIVTTWVLCAVLKFIVGEEFTQIPLFGVSILGIISGIMMGVVTVLFSARSPAKRAAKVSPVAAVSGNIEREYGKTAWHPVNIRCMKIETALGVHHAASAKKNLILMTGSFALSIILVLTFSVMIDWVGYLMPQSSSESDINITSNDGSDSIDSALVDKIKDMDGVKQTYGRRSCFEVPAEWDDDATLLGNVDIVSFDDFDLECLKKDNVLKKGSQLSKVYGASNYVLAVSDSNSYWKIGDKLHIGGEELEIAGLLKYDPFSSDGITNGKVTLITSAETFIRLTGIDDYSLVMIQTKSDITNEEVQEIQKAVGNGYEFSDKRGESTSGTYFAFVTCVYGFLSIIILVTIINIINSISMSVSAKTKQYGAMRAVGMDEHQITKMIVVESFTYAFWGCTVGCVIGLVLHKLLYHVLITNYFPYAVWNVPVTSLAVIFLFVFGAAVVAAYAPVKRMLNMAITDTINEL